MVAQPVGEYISAVNGGRQDTVGSHFPLRIALLAPLPVQVYNGGAASFAKSGGYRWEAFYVCPVFLLNLFITEVQEPAFRL